jgi:hypothetical protein
MGVRLPQRAGTVLATGEHAGPGEDPLRADLQVDPTALHAPHPVSPARSRQPLAGVCRQGVAQELREAGGLPVADARS